MRLENPYSLLWCREKEGIITSCWLQIPRRLSCILPSLAVEDFISYPSSISVKGEMKHVFFAFWSTSTRLDLSGWLPMIVKNWIQHAQTDSPRFLKGILGNVGQVVEVSKTRQGKECIWVRIYNPQEFHYFIRFTVSIFFQQHPFNVLTFLVGSDILAQVSNYPLPWEFTGHNERLCFKVAPSSLYKPVRTVLGHTQHLTLKVFKLHTKGCLLLTKQPWDKGRYSAPVHVNCFWSLKINLGKKGTSYVCCRVENLSRRAAVRKDHSCIVKILITVHEINMDTVCPH